MVVFAGRGVEASRNIEGSESGKKSFSIAARTKFLLVSRWGLPVVCLAEGFPSGVQLVEELLH
jgi:hypothetical protein